MKHEIPKEIIEEFMKRSSRMYIGDYLGEPPQTTCKDKTYKLVGNTIYIRPSTETNPDFYVGLLKKQLGREWIQKQMQHNTKHFLLDCFIKYEEWKCKKIDDKELVGITSAGIPLAIPDGYSVFLMSLAHDVYALLSTSNFPEQLLNRLRDITQFQAARYETSIAGIFTRRGFKVNFFDDNKVDTKHCEFIASKDNLKVIIEAKSRHRRGVINTPGLANHKKNLKGDIQQLIKEALEKDAMGLPFYVFVDLNSPLTLEINSKKAWFNMVRSIMTNKLVVNKATCNAVVITNFSFHYQQDLQTKPPECIVYINPSPKIDFNDDKLLKILEPEINNYGAVI